MSNSNSSAFQYFGLSCPSGGDFYICEDTKTRFVGCCTSNPCDNDGTCKQEDLRYSTFKADMYSELPTQDCDDPRGIDIWWTCKFANPPFMGCCAENACGESGCSRSALRPAKLSSLENNALNFLTPNTNAKPSSSSTPPKDTKGGNESGLSTGAVAGIAVGATVVGLLLIAFLAWRFWWLPKKKAQHHPLTPSMNQPDTPGTYNTGFGPHSHGQSPMSGYQQSFASTPTAVGHYPSGATPDMYNKYSPSQQSPAMYSDHQYQQQVPQAYSQVSYVHEMDGAQTAPQEMSAGYDTEGQSRVHPRQDHISVSR